MDDSNFNKENLGQSSNTSSTKDVRLRDVVGNPADFEKWVTHWCGRQPEETTISVDTLREVIGRLLAEGGYKNWYAKDFLEITKRLEGVCFVQGGREQCPYDPYVEQVDELIRDHPELAAFIDPLYCFLEADLNLVTRQQINNAVANFPQAAPGGGATIWSAPVTGPLTDCFVFNGPAGPAESSRTAFMSHMVTALGGNAFFGFISSNQPMKFAPGL